MKIAGPARAAIAVKIPEKGKHGMMPERVLRIGQDIAEPEL
jgi:hypothetical protein